MNKETNNTRFLKENLKNSLSKKHASYLGTTIPEDYFSTSKKQILEKITEVSENQLTKKQSIFWLQKPIRYAVVASIAVFISITIWLQNTNKTKQTEKLSYESIVISDAILLNSLFIEDAQLENFTDATLFYEILVKAELSEQNLDNLIFNTILLEDTLLDNDLDEKIIETFIL